MANSPVVPAFPLPPTLIDRTAFAAMLSMGASTFDRHKAAGKVGPKPVRIGGCLRWHRAEVEAWLAHRNGDELYSVETWPAAWHQINRNNRTKHSS